MSNDRRTYESLPHDYRDEVYKGLPNISMARHMTESYELHRKEKLLLDTIENIKSALNEAVHQERFTATVEINTFIYRNNISKREFEVFKTALEMRGIVVEGEHNGFAMSPLKMSW